MCPRREVAATGKKEEEKKKKRREQAWSKEQDVKAAKRGKIRKSANAAKIVM